MANRILLKGESQVVSKEAIASGAITPGDLIEFGGTNDVQRHSTTKGNARSAIAIELKEVGNDIDTDYSSGETVHYGVFPAGTEFNGQLASGTDLTTASEANIAKGDPLTSAGGETNGGGKLKKWSTTTDSADSDNIVGYAMEAVDNSSANSGVFARIQVEAA